MRGRRKGTIAESLGSLDDPANGTLEPAVVDLGSRSGRRGDDGAISPKERAALDAAASVAVPGEPLSISELSRVMGINRNSLSATVERLRYRGLWPYAPASKGGPGRPRKPVPAQVPAPMPGVAIEAADIMPAASDADRGADPAELAEVRTLARLDAIFDGMSPRLRELALAYLAARYDR